MTALADPAVPCSPRFRALTHRIAAYARLAKRKSKVFVRCIERIRSGARNLAARQACDGVICGHTHHAESLDAAPDQPVAYYNSGCWTENPSTYLTVAEGRVELLRYEPALVEA